MRKCRLFQVDKYRKFINCNNVIEAFNECLFDIQDWSFDQL